MMATQTHGRRIDSLDQYFDDLALGDHVVSRGRTITEADISVYAGFSGEYHPLHTDDEFARRGPFGERIAHGCLTLSVATGLEFSLMGSLTDSKIMAFYGMDRVRFLSPVRIGDTLHLRGEVTALDEKDERRGVVTIHQEIVNQEGTTVAALDKRTLHARKETA